MRRNTTISRADGSSGHSLSSSHLRFSRHDLLRRLGAGAIGLSFLPSGSDLAAAYSATNVKSAEFPSVELPPDVGQSALQVYVESTGHTIRGSMLDYWRATGAASVFGAPISEPFAAGNGYYSQAFECVVLQYRPDMFYTADPIMRAMPIKVALEQLRSDARRAPADPRSLPWLELDADGVRVSQALKAGGIFVEETGHTIVDEFLVWYKFNEGAFYLGNPLSESFQDRGVIVQYFEGGMLRQSEAGVALAPIVSELASHLGIDTTSVEPGDLPVFDELIFWLADNPIPLGNPYSPGQKWIEISVPEQRLWAYHGTTLISSTLVSTGLPPNETERGLFHVRLKYPLQDLAGFTDDTGEVLGFGEAPPGTTPYTVEDVPDVMYFNLDAEALHGAYWHNNFGQKMSHGCVNLPLHFAKWLYGWAPIGTSVWVHD